MGEAGGAGALDHPSERGKLSAAPSDQRDEAAARDGPEQKAGLAAGRGGELGADDLDPVVGLSAHRDAGNRAAEALAGRRIAGARRERGLERGRHRRGALRGAAEHAEHLAPGAHPDGDQVDPDLDREQLLVGDHPGGDHVTETVGGGGVGGLVEQAAAVAEQRRTGAVGDREHGEAGPERVEGAEPVDSRAQQRLRDDGPIADLDQLERAGVPRPPARGDQRPGEAAAVDAVEAQPERV